MCKTCNLGNIMRRRTSTTKTNPTDSLIGGALGAGVTLGVDQVVDMLSPTLNENIKAAAPAIAAVGVGMLMPNMVKSKTAQNALGAAVAIGIYRLGTNLLATGLVSGYPTYGLGFPLSDNSGDDQSADSMS